MKLYSLHTHRSGFTIVELLVIIVVIAILASITIVSYSMITDNARHKTAETDAQGIAVYLNKYKAENGAYPASLDLLSSTPKAESTFQYTYDAVNNTYCVTASVKGASAYVVSGNSVAKDGGCPGHGVNGEGPVTNIASNPSAETDCTGVSGYFSAPLTACPTNGGAVSGTKIFSTTTNSTTSSQGLIHTVTTSAKPNQQYTCSISLKGTNGSLVALSGRPATAANGYISEGLGSKSVTLTSAWQRHTITFTTPATTGILRIQYRLGSPATGITMQSDAIMCTEGATDYPYADGNTANWLWKGTVNNSESVGPAIQ